MNTLKLEKALRLTGTPVPARLTAELLRTELMRFGGILFADAGNPERWIAERRQRASRYRIPMLRTAQYHNEVRALAYETMGLNVTRDSANADYLVRLPEHAIVIIPRDAWHCWYPQTAYDEPQLVCLSYPPRYPASSALILRENFRFSRPALDPDEQRADPCVDTAFHNPYSAYWLAPPKRRAASQPR